MSQLISDACRHGGAMNALRLAAFRREAAKVVPEHKREFLIQAYIATFEMPGDAELETALLRQALRELAREWA